MRPRVHALTVSSELGEFNDELRQVFHDLGRMTGNEGLAGECSPAVDIYETDESVEVIADLPGVDRLAIRVLRKGDWLLIAGEKPPRRVRTESSFHLVERDYGRFARGVRVSRACDMSRASATLTLGELRVSLPKVPERRGVVQPIPIRDNSH